MNHGFIKTAAAVPHVHVANPARNVEEIENLVARAAGQGVEVVCFPELSITGYTCQDLFAQQLLLREAESAMVRLLDATRALDIICLIGLPIAYEGLLLNCAAVVQHGRVLGLVPKTFIPNYNEFYEQRWFASASALPSNAEVWLCGARVPLSNRLLFETDTFTFGIEICEDLWAALPPSTHLAAAGADIIFNLSASNEVIGKASYLRSLVQSQSARLIAGYVYASCGWGESTQDVVYAGRTYIAENGHILAEGERFSMQEQLVVSEIDVERLRRERRVNTSFAELKRTDFAPAASTFQRISLDPVALSQTPQALTRHVEVHPFVPTGTMLDERCEEILCIQSEGLARRVDHTRARCVVVGISGGLDSTLALLVCAHAFDRLGRSRREIVGVTMPGFGTTGRTYNNALALMQALGITVREIPILDAVKQHFRDIDHDEAKHDTTYENAQARERTQILMDVACEMGGFVVGTGDLSELALGWATYNGDHMSMYGVNVSIPKTLVRHLVKWFAENVADEATAAILLDVVDTPISPELLPASENDEIQQVTEDLVGPYELHDFFLYYTLRHGFTPSKIFYLAQHAFHEQYTDDVLRRWLATFCRRFFSQQFKRSCLPDGPKVGSCALSPRGDWRMPSDAESEAWLRDADTEV